MVCCLVSLIGLPPFAGFVGKYWILMGLGSLNSGLGWFLVIVAVFNTLISVYYYMRIVVLMTLRDDEQRPVRSPLAGVALVNFCALVLVFLLVFASPFKSRTDSFTRNLFEPVAGAAQKTVAVASVAVDAD